MLKQFWDKLRNGPLLQSGILTIAFLLILGATGGSVFLLVGEASTAASPVYLTRSTYIGDLIVTIPMSGTLVSAHTYNLNFRISGQLATIDVQVGQQVQAGQALASLDTTQLQDAVAQAQTQVNNAQAIVNADQTLLNDQQSLYTATVNDASATCDPDDPNPADDNDGNDINQNCIAKIQAQALLALDQARQQLVQAQGNLSAASAALKTAQDNLAAATLTAPAAGTVAAIHGSIGQYLTPPLPGTATSTQPFLVLTDLNTLQVVAQTSAANISRIQVGQPVRFIVPSQPGQIFSGSVASFSPVAQGTTYIVQVNVDEQSLHGARLLPGMAVTMRVAIIQHHQVLLVSNDALRYAHSLPPTTAMQLSAANHQLDSRNLFNQPTASTQPATSGGTVVVFQHGALVKRHVLLGASDGVVTEVIAGLEPGEATVVGTTASAFVFRPGALVHGVQSRSLDLPRHQASSS
jgi:multidrug efflux pump subunit AcrA (membrane-fusion protein)